MSPDAPAVVFDCDGTLADTERYGHLPAFDETFAELGLGVSWSEEDYAGLLAIGGGKERMATLLTPAFVAEHGLPADPDGQRALLADWHRRKTARYVAMVEAGRLPPRPGIPRLIGAALAAGWTVAVASTSAVESVRAVLRGCVGATTAERVPVFAGDAVPAKKPAPDVYLLACSELGVPPARTLAVEDSRNGLLAARAAGLPCLVTVNGYTEHEDFAGAALVVSDLGDPDADPVRVLADPHGVAPSHHLTLADLERCLDTGPDDGGTDTDTPARTGGPR